MNHNQEISRYIDIAKKYFTFNKELPNLKAIFVPHAGFQFSGLCAATAYYPLMQSKNNIKGVILLCTHHFGKRTDQVITIKKVVDMPEWIFEDTENYFDREHSYTNNMEFINYVLPGVNVIPFLLGHETPIKEFSEYVIRMINKGFLIVCTSDLTHYGEKFQNIKQDLKEPIQSYVNRYESELLDAMVNGNIRKCYNVFTKYKELTACGEIGIKVLIHISNTLSLHGKVVCHYDSEAITNIKSKSFSDLFTISTEYIPTFVRYASIVFSASNLDNIKSKFDDYYLLSIPKSVIENKIVNDTNNLNFGNYIYWNKQVNGAFVTVKNKNNDQVRACMGNYESSSKTTMDNCINSSYSCVKDADIRWKNPLKMIELDNLSYEISILELKKNWKKYPAIDARKYYKREDNSGIVLYLPSYKTLATFLPSVWQEKSEWSIDDLMNKLSEKATGNDNAWKNDPNALIEVYGTETIE